MQESVLACVQTTNHKLNITMTRTEQGVVHGVLKNTSRNKLTEYILKKNCIRGKIAVTTEQCNIKLKKINYIISIKD